MEGVWNVLGATIAVVLLWAFWVLVVLVIPGLIAVYASMLFPLTGQWRKKWADRRSRLKQ